VTTLYPIHSVIISYDSTRAITVTKRNEREYYVKMYDLNTYELTFEEKLGGGPEDYIKIKEVEQTIDGKKYCICFFNDGKFYMRSFGKSTRSDAEIKANEVDINTLLGLDNWTMAISGFSDPYITCCFIDDDRVFVNLFYNPTCTHYHFIYNFKSHKMEGNPVNKVLDCSRKNFPYKCFYNEEKDEIYSFYR